MPLLLTFVFLLLGIVTELPLQGSTLKFESYEKQIKAPFVVYADFECKLVPVGDGTDGAAKTKKKHQHVPSSFAYLIKCSFDESLDHLEVYRGEECGPKFVKGLTEKIKDLYETHVFNRYVPLVMSAEEEKEFKNCTNCFICKKDITDPSEKARDHCHITGKYRGCAHNDCNIKYRLKHEVPVIFHNFSKYDAHLFIKELTELESDQNIKIIPSNTETYISVAKSVKLQSTGEAPSKKQKTDKVKQVYLNIVFKDSFRFLSASIDALSKSLDPSTDFKNLEKHFPVNSGMLKRKGRFNLFNLYLYIFLIMVLTFLFYIILYRCISI